jgi:hypothetical protein
MRDVVSLPVLALLALAACHADGDLPVAEGNSADGKVHIAMTDGGRGSNKVSVKVPGFSANVALPDLDLGSHIDLDGIKLAPDSIVKSLDVTAHDTAADKDGGIVRLSFADTKAPGAIIDHYARAAIAAAYTDMIRTSTSVTARKGDKTFAVQVAQQGSGSQGIITLAGKG